MLNLFTQQDQKLQADLGITMSGKTENMICHKKLPLFTVFSI